MSLAKFLRFHAGDLHSIASVIGGLLNAVPVNAQDRARLEAGLDLITKSADNVTDYLNRTATKDADKAPSKPAPAAKDLTEAQIAKGLRSALDKGALATMILDAVRGEVSRQMDSATAPAPVIAPGTPGPVASQAGEAAKGGDNTGTASVSQHDDGTGTGTDEIKA